MRCAPLPVLLACWYLTACGGSASETPMPQEPLPHAGPEPTSTDGQVSPPPATEASRDEEVPPLSSRE